MTTENQRQKQFTLIDEYLKIIYKKIKGEKDFSKLTIIEKNFLLIDKAEAEIHNGGFNQFFYNHSGEFTYETLDAYKYFGAENIVLIFQQAIELFPCNIIPKDTIERRKEMIDIDYSNNIKWDKLDTSFDQEDEIVDILYKIAKTNI